MTKALAHRPVRADLREVFQIEVRTAAIEAADHRFRWRHGRDEAAMIGVEQAEQGGGADGSKRATDAEQQRCSLSSGFHD